MAELVKAQIQEKDGAGKVVCAFNPKQFTISSSAEWHESHVAGAASAPPTQFLGTRPRQLQMELLFDANWPGYKNGSPPGDVDRDVKQLLDWTNPKPGTSSSDQPNPPLLHFVWGVAKYAFFDAYLQSVSVSYTEFDGDGKPLRANANVTFKEVPANPQNANSPPPTNPSSGGVPGRRTHTMAAGDSLQSIAYEEYGDPNLWRGLAEINDIDDPLRVPIGTAILVPPTNEARERS